ncbi:protein of unknown function [Candidatus Nitrosocosmicus franklandus]|uniref:Uncharacterized protein n=1 Tax=Candidatus Nitrosocosmicus franklandianus TaxID=1798806 RepID=A0A484I9X5_9ARCH|nr:protein of unknown function [Candidatus Nitrosocosmicus franklandus]
MYEYLHKSDGIVFDCQFILSFNLDICMIFSNYALGLELYIKFVTIFD